MSCQSTASTIQPFNDGLSLTWTLARALSATKSSSHDQRICTWTWNSCITKLSPGSTLLRGSVTHRWPPQHLPPQSWKEGRNGAVRSRIGDRHCEYCERFPITFLSVINHMNSHRNFTNIRAASWLRFSVSFMKMIYGQK
jgi:hypothetical protein